MPALITWRNARLTEFTTSARSLKQKKQSGHHAPPTPKANTPNCAFRVLEQVLFMLTCHRGHCISIRVCTVLYNTLENAGLYCMSQMNNRPGQHAAPMMVGAPSSVREADESIQVCTMCRHDDETVFFHFGSFIRSLYYCSYATTSSHRFLVHCIIIIQQHLSVTRMIENRRSSASRNRRATFSLIHKVRGHARPYSSRGWDHVFHSNTHIAHTAKRRRR